MIKFKSIQRPMTKIGTKEQELKYVLQLLSSGQIGEKEVVNFCSKHTNVPQATVRAVLDSFCQTWRCGNFLSYDILQGCGRQHQGRLGTAGKD